MQATLPPGKRVGVITATAKSLTPRHLEAAGVPLDTPIVGTETGREFYRTATLGEKEHLDVTLAEHDILTAGRTLTAQHDNIGAIGWNAPTCRTTSAHFHQAGRKSLAL